VLEILEQRLPTGRGGQDLVVQPQLSLAAGLCGTHRRVGGSHEILGVPAVTGHRQADAGIERWFVG
jgi:hypothetical protein